MACESKWQNLAGDREEKVDYGARESLGTFFFFFTTFFLIKKIMHAHSKKNFFFKEHKRYTIKSKSPFLSQTSSSQYLSSEASHC
jgi:hypothetical protein